MGAADSILSLIAAAEKRRIEYQSTGNVVCASLAAQYVAGLTDALDFVHSEVQLARTLETVRQAGEDMRRMNAAVLQAYDPPRDPSGCTCDSRQPADPHDRECLHAEDDPTTGRML